MITLALVGLGKIARDQHVPALATSGRFRLAATASPQDRLDGIPAFADLDALLASDVAVAAIAICTPPAVRHAVAVRAIDAGLHVLLEKPPAATLSQCADLVARARSRGVTLFAAWHSREAAGVAPARAWLAGKRIRAARIAWREDIRRWHPGQEWILGPGGFGVFDPGINALSILTAILPDAVVLTDATMTVPAGRASPVAASLTMRAGAAPVTAEFDFLQTGPQCWTIEIDTDDGALILEAGGRILRTGDGPATAGDDVEYPALYRRFAALIAAGESDVDLAPLYLVADAFLIAERRETAPFAF